MLNTIVKEELKKKEEYEKKGEAYTPQVFLKICSEGGYTSHGNAITSIVENCKIDVHGIVEGECHSATLPILLACKTRKARQGSSFLIHYGYNDIDLSTNQLKDYYKSQMEMEAICEKYILSKTKLTKRKYRSLCTSDMCFFTDSALKYGIIDEVI